MESPDTPKQTSPPDEPAEFTVPLLPSPPETFLSRWETTIPSQNPAAVACGYSCLLDLAIADASVAAKVLVVLLLRRLTIHAIKAFAVFLPGRRRCCASGCRCSLKASFSCFEGAPAPVMFEICRGQVTHVPAPRNPAMLHHSHGLSHTRTRGVGSKKTERQGGRVGRGE